MPDWSIEAQIGYPLISEVAPSPDGRRILFVAREPLMTEERSEFLTHLFLAEAAGGPPRQLTFGDQSDHSPRWSPDGRRIAFVSTRGGRGELRAMSSDGGESWALASVPGGDISDPRWSRDGGRVAFLAPAPQGEAHERSRRARDDAFRWGEQHRSARVASVPFGVAPRPLPEPEWATDGSFHVMSYDWLADGSGFALAASATTVADDWPESWLAVAPRSGGEPRRLGLLASWAPRPLVSPDGGAIAAIVSDGAPRWAISFRAAIFTLQGGEPRLLAETPDAQPDLVGWAPDGTQLIAQEFAGVGARLLALPADGSAAREVAAPPMFSAAAIGAGGQIALVAEDFGQPNAVALIDAPGGAPRLAASPALPEGWPDAPLPRAEVLRWRSPDGLEIEGIVTYPLGYESGQRCPLVVIVHGGPAGCFQRTFLGTPAGYGQICALARRGYATLRANPRGSSGYGRGFRFANERDWGGGDFRDIMAGVDQLVEQGLADPGKLAVMGWSYGGFMASWAITQTDRFQAACIGAPVTDPVSFNGTADIPGFIPDYFGAEFWEDPEAYRRQSPLQQIARASTPSLIQHGDADIRVPLSQGRQLYEALRRRGVPAELVVYPRQGHLFSEPRMIIDCRSRALEWLARYLG